MPEQPRAVVAMPIFNEERHVVEALESLTAQTEHRLRIVVIDNSSTDRSNELASGVARNDGRVTVERTPHRLGMVDNWAFAARSARQIHPGIPYFAWAGGHDRWHPRWLEALALELDASPEAIGAFPLALEIDADGRPLGAVVSRGDTAGIRVARDRAALKLPGTTLHALLRSESLDRTGLARRVLLPDRLFLAELAAVGPLKEVPETLWYRRVTSPRSAADHRRQSMSTLFTGRVPAHTRLPWQLVHAGVLLWSLGIRGNGVLPRREGPGVALSHLKLTSGAVARKWRRLSSPVRQALRSSGRAVGRALARALRHSGRALRRYRRQVAKRVTRVRRRFARMIKRGRLAFGAAVGYGG